MERVKELQWLWRPQKVVVSHEPHRKEHYVFPFVCCSVVALFTIWVIFSTFYMGFILGEAIYGFNMGRQFGMASFILELFTWIFSLLALHTMKPIYTQTLLIYRAVCAVLFVTLFLLKLWLQNPTYENGMPMTLWDHAMSMMPYTLIACIIVYIAHYYMLIVFYIYVRNLQLYKEQNFGFVRV